MAVPLEVHRAHAATIATWSPDSPPPATSVQPSFAAEVSVDDVILAYAEFARTHYRKRGRLTQEYSRIQGALRVLRRVCENIAADSFTVDDLERVREGYIAAGYTRATCNAYVGIVKRMFRWASAKRLVRRGIFGELQDLLPLDPGRGNVAEGAGVEPVSVATVLRTLPHMEAGARDLCRFLGVTACRPEEGCIARACDFITHAKHGRVYRPQWHKTQHKGVQRFVPISRAAWSIIQPLIAAASSPEAFLFTAPSGAAYTPGRLNLAVGRACAAAWPNPHEAMLAAAAQALRKQGKWRGGRRMVECLKHVAAEMSETVAKAEEWRRAHTWNPRQLRHAKLTQLRHRNGLEAAQVQAGHTSARMTEVYAELVPDSIDIDAALVLSWTAGADPEALILKLTPKPRRKSPVKKLPHALAGATHARPARRAASVVEVHQ